MKLVTVGDFYLKAIQIWIKYPKNATCPKREMIDVFS